MENVRKKVAQKQFVKSPGFLCNYCEFEKFVKPINTIKRWYGVFRYCNSNEKDIQRYKTRLRRVSKIIQKLNGAAPIYRTIYNFTGTPHWSNAIIDRIFFDFDVDKKKPETELIEARRFHEFLLEKKLSHSIFFSGRGFHIFVKTKTVHSNELENPRGAVKRAHTIIAEEAGIAPDPTTKDILRISRVPNTLNIRSKLFCIPLVHEQIYLKKYQIEKLARRQRMISRFIMEKNY
jgi:hypothetical protein